MAYCEASGTLSEALPFPNASVARSQLVLILVLFPQIALWLPSTMSR